MNKFLTLTIYRTKDMFWLLVFLFMVFGFADFENRKSKTSLKQKWVEVEGDYFILGGKEKETERGTKTGSGRTFQVMSQGPTSSR